MSSTASWSYTNKATVWPLTGTDDWSGQDAYGTPYLIDCTWKGSDKIKRDADGNEFVSKDIYYTESELPKRKDMIAKGDQVATANPVDAGASEIQVVDEFDMSFFGEKPDYSIFT